MASTFAYLNLDHFSSLSSKIRSPRSTDTFDTVYNSRAAIVMREDVTFALAE